MTQNDPFDLPNTILPRDGEDSLRRAKIAAQTIADNRGTDIVLLDLRTQTYAFDYFVIATGTSHRQLHAMSDAIDQVFEKEMKEKKIGTEGYRAGRWVLLDYGDVVIHLFDAETRDFFRLEDLWGGGERIAFVPVSGE
ncbi:MAG: ribosome silencing factor [Planctomycetia bacterium]|nr:ribosome silencing factor [Planctomycetia bacterium]